MAPIKKIEHFRVKPRWLFVKITDNEGKVGWGEGTLEGHSLAVEGALEEIIVRLIGKEAKYDHLAKYAANALTAATATSNIFGSSFGGWDSIEAVQCLCQLSLVLTSLYGI